MRSKTIKNQKKGVTIEDNLTLNRSEQLRHEYNSSQYSIINLKGGFGDLGTDYR